MKAWHIVVIILSLLCLGMYTQPLMKQTKDLQAKKQNLEIEFKSMNTQLNKIKETQIKKEQAEINFAQQIPLFNEQEKLLQTIQTITLKNGFSFQSVSFTKGQNPVLGIPEIKISFLTEGNKKNLIKFLESIEKNKRFLGMESLNINTHEEGGEPIVSFNVSLYGFYQKDL